MKVEVRWGDGAKVGGWIDRTEVRWKNTVSYSHTGGSSDPTCGGPGHAGPNAYNGPATVAPGTKVFARPGSGFWATVSQPGPFFFVIWRNSQWARLGQTPDIGCGRLDHAYIRADQVKKAQAASSGGSTAPR